LRTYKRAQARLAACGHPGFRVASHFACHDTSVWPSERPQSRPVLWAGCILGCLCV